jgi:hypothetical protein
MGLDVSRADFLRALGAAAARVPATGQAALIFEP